MKTVSFLKRYALLFLLLICCYTELKAQTFNYLHTNFKNPPESTKPWVYWYWISDHISKEGITKDLEAMATMDGANLKKGHIGDQQIKP